MARSGEWAHRLPRGKRAPETEINLFSDFCNRNMDYENSLLKRKTDKKSTGFFSVLPSNNGAALAAYFTHGFLKGIAPAESRLYFGDAH
jgi:hypothetical protein